MDGQWLLEFFRIFSTLTIFRDCSALMKLIKKKWRKLCACHFGMWVRAFQMSFDFRAKALNAFNASSACRLYFGWAIDDGTYPFAWCVRVCVRVCMFAFARACIWVRAYNVHSWIKRTDIVCVFFSRVNWFLWLKFTFAIVERHNVWYGIPP